MATSVSNGNNSASVAGLTASLPKDQSALKTALHSAAPVEVLMPKMSSQAICLAATSEHPAAIARMTQSLNELSVGCKVPSLVVDGSNSTAAQRAQALANRGSGSDESQRADSSSEMGTKPASLDGKSITSGTTFALDEKESLRPDDSASVKAAAEEDDSLSIRGSLIAGSRMSSDLAARARGIQLGDMPERRLVQQTAVAHGHGVLTPHSASSEQPPPSIPLRSAGGSSDALNVIYRQAPDEKLLEALAAPRDRYFLLRLEKDVIDFVQDSKYVSSLFCKH